MTAALCLPPTPRRHGFLHCASLILAFLAVLSAGRAADAHAKPAADVSLAIGKPLVVVTTSLLATAVHDLAGTTFSVETLMPAGTCPGQFDLDPGQARRIRSALLVLRHERQVFLDARFGAAGVDAGRIAAPRSPGLWTVPSVYAGYCTLIGAELARRQPGSAKIIAARVHALEDDMGRLAGVILAKAAPLRGTRVVAAQFQAEFLGWLGLEVVGTFPPTDDPPPALLRANLSLAREKKASLVAGNVQSGERLPATLAEAVGIPVAMLSNFPDRAQAGAMRSLLEENVDRLLAAVDRGRRQGK